MRRIILVSIIVFTGVQAAIAADRFDPEMKVVCRGSTTVSPKVLLGQLVGSEKMQASDIDPNNDFSLDYPNQIKAVFQPTSLCRKSPDNPLGTGIYACKKGEVDALMQAGENLYDFFKRSSSLVRPGQKGYQVTPAVTGTGDPHKIEEYFLNPGSTYTVTCVGNVVGAGTGSTPNGGADAPSALDAIRLRKNVTDLTISRSNAAAFKALDRATLSANADYEHRSDAFNIQGVLGYSLGKVFSGTDSFELIPFFSYTQQYVAGNNPKKVTPIQNIGGGLAGAFRWRALDGSYQTLELYPEQIHSNTTNSDLTSGNIFYIPDLPIALQPLLPFVGEDWFPFGPQAFAIRAIPQAHLIYSHVEDPGTNLTLLKSSEFGRVGPKVDVWVFAASGWLQGFSINASYEWQTPFYGPKGSYEHFEGSLNYALPSTAGLAHAG